MNKKTLQSFSYTLPGLILIALGIILVLFKDQFILKLTHIFIFLMLLQGLMDGLGLIFKKTHTSLLLASGKIICAIILFFNQTLPLHLATRLFGLYVIFNGIVRIITFYLEYKDHIKGKWFSFFDSLFYLTLGLGCLFTPALHATNILIICGFYIMVLGYTYLRDGIGILVPYPQDRIKRKIRIHLPVFLEAMIPYKILKTINNALSIEDAMTTQKEYDTIIPDIEIYIHVSNEGFGTVGHVDLGYQGKVISYGSYDYASYKLGGLIGDGVLFVCDKKDYIPFCKKYRNKTIFAFGLKLNSQQKANIKKYFEEFKNMLIPFTCHIQKYPDQEIDPLDYASLLYKHTHASLYKFKKTRFKTYFGLSTNCVLLADSILGKAGIDLLTINGIITPGTYYDYFNKEYQKENSMVISKTVH